MIILLTIDIPKQNVLSLEFGQKVQREVTLILGKAELPVSTVWNGWKEASAPKQLDLFFLFYRTFLSANPSDCSLSFSCSELTT